MNTWINDIQKRLRIPFALTISLLALVGTLALLGTWRGGPTLVRAQGPDGNAVYYVAPDCAGAPAPCHTTVQAAVDAVDADDDEIWVATGTYTGTIGRPAPPGYVGPATIDQVVYVSTTLTIRGGYSPGFTETNPISYPTTLDAQEDGRVLFIAGDVTATIEGLRVTGGDATGLEGRTGNDDYGGGIYVITSTVAISDCEIYSNTASTTGDGWGGGVHVYRGDAALSGNTIVSNTASTADLGGGGGMLIYESVATLSDNAIINNTASTADTGSGGGVYVNQSDGGVTLEGNHVQGNAASTSTGDHGDGGGVRIYLSDDVTLSDNTIVSNTAGNDWSEGGGVHFSSISRDATLSSNTVQGNTASEDDYGEGGGVYLGGDDATLEGNTILSNTASEGDDGEGGGLYVYGDNATLSGNTVQSNTASEGQNGKGGGMHVDGDDATLGGNTVQGNTASKGGDGYGGGVSLYNNSGATLQGNTIVSNTAASNQTGVGQGGGVWISRSEPFTMTNNVVADNHANSQGSGLWFGDEWWDTSGRLLHTTIADNAPGGDSGQGVYVGLNATLAFTNTIIAGHDVGLVVTDTVAVTLGNTLWHGNGTDTAGDGAVISHANIHDDPSFVDPGSDDYHITPDSGAFDAGASTDLATDIDGEARETDPMRPDPPDVGADEIKDLTIRRAIASELTFGAACARLVFTDTGSLTAITVTVRPGRFPSTNPSDRVVSRTIVITPSSGANYTATLAACYEEEELNGLTESDLQLYRGTWGSSSWQGHHTIRDPAHNVVTATNVTDFSPWVIGEEGTEPTALTLRWVDARSDLALLPGVTALLLAALGIVWRRRRGRCDHHQGHAR